VHLLAQTMLQRLAFIRTVQTRIRSMDLTISSASPQTYVGVPSPHGSLLLLEGEVTKYYGVVDLWTCYFTGDLCLERSSFVIL
jgi:hypothetical protein